MTTLIRLGAASTRDTDLLLHLQRPEYSTMEVLQALAGGCLDLPSSLQSPRERWRWFAELLVHPSRGMTTLAPEHSELFSTVAELCTLTAECDPRPLSEDINGDMSSPLFRDLFALRARWMLVESASIDATETATPNGWNPADVAAELVTDALDYLGERETTGAQALTAAFGALIHTHGHATARSMLTDSLASAGSSATASRSLRSVS